MSHAKTCIPYKYYWICMQKSGETQRRVREGLSTLKRPKRCHLCRKTFACDKYDQHFQACYRVQNKKIDDQRAQVRNKAGPQRNSQPHAEPQAHSKNQRNNYQKQRRPETGNRFRIKNVSSSIPGSQKPSPKPGELSRKPQSVSTAQNFNLSEPKKQQSSWQPAEEAIAQKPEGQGNLESLSESKEPKGESVSGSVALTSPIPQASLNPEERIEDTQRELQTQVAVAPSTHSRVQQEVTRPVLFVQDPEQEETENAESPFNIQAMIANSNCIIDFIRSTEVMGMDQTLNTMMTQLQQLNLIAQQILQLNQLGRALAFRIGNVFAARIQELQNAIINQIGIALMRGFNGRLGIELHVLMSQQPQLKVGFTSEEIDQIFQEKLSLDEKECAICLMDMKRSQLVMELQCNHTFHPGCVREWLISSKKCPLCRRVQIERRQ